MARMISLKEAAAETGLSYEFLRRLCINGEVFCIRSGVKWLINASSLAKYLGGDE
jgi:excisionase family DNA binding protein